MAFVKPFALEYDPWDWQNGFYRINEGHIACETDSLCRNKRYYNYYDDPAWLEYKNRKTKEILAKHGNDKRIVELVRQRKEMEYYDFEIKKYNFKQNQKSKETLKNRYQYIQEARQVYKGLTQEKKDVWNWISYFNGNKAKNSGFIDFLSSYTKYKMGIQAYQEWPQIYDQEQPNTTQIENVGVWRQTAYKCQFWCIFRHERKTLGEVTRILIEPTPRKVGEGIDRPTVIKKVYYDSEWTGYMVRIYAPKRQIYAYTAYTVNDWGVRNTGETFTLTGIPWVDWKRDYWDKYWNWWTSQFEPCDPPEIYTYDGTY